MLQRYVNMLSIGLLLLSNSCLKQTNDPIVPEPPTDDVVESRYYKDGEVRVLFKSQVNAANVVIIGDGFVLSDLRKQGEYDKAVEKVMNDLFSVEPFKSYKQYFSVYTVYAQSTRRGAVLGESNIDNHTKFNAYFDSDIQRLLYIKNAELAEEYFAKAIPQATVHFKIVVVNDDRYGGAGGSFAVVSRNSQANKILLHEAGHVFADLADEYIDEDVAYLYPLSKIGEYPNVDTTKNLAKIKWKHFVEHSDYKSVVSAFEGGFYRATGVYRPEAFSIMSSTASITYNAPSREAIVKRILEIAGKPYNFEEFVQMDKPNIQSIGLDAWIYTKTPMPIRVWYKEDNKVELSRIRKP